MKNDPTAFLCSIKDFQQINGCLPFRIDPLHSSNDTVALQPVVRQTKCFKRAFDSSWNIYTLFSLPRIHTHPWCVTYYNLTYVVWSIAIVFLKHLFDCHFDFDMIEIETDLSSSIVIISAKPEFTNCIISKIVFRMQICVGFMNSS